ncbi:MAG TPA: LicD family protein [Candidatus Hungatella pullicola]|nr:LicD family protein [Candidatus Hungatella pullicola]
MARFYEPEILHRVQQMELDILKDVMKLCRDNGLTFFGMAGTAIGAIRHQGFIPWDDDIDIAMPRRDFEKLLQLVEEQMGDKYYILNYRTNENYPLMTTRICRRGTRFVDSPMRDVDCPFGIFLDMYVYDNIPDNDLAMKLQAWEAWFYSKLLILRSIPRPYLAQTGWKAKVITGICIGVHWMLKSLHVSKKGLAGRCERVCRRYEKKKTKRMAFYPDTNPFWNVVDKSGLRPMQVLTFEGLKMPFPSTEDKILTYMYGNYMELPPVEKRKTHYPYILDLGDGTVLGDGAADKTKKEDVKP